MKLERDQQTGKYILRIDSSLYKETDCLRYVFHKLILGYTQASDGTKSAITEYGTAFHKGLQARAEGKSLDEQLKIVTEHFSDPTILVPDNEWRNIGHLVNTYVAYDTYWKSNGDLIIPRKAEQRFAYPFFRTARTEVLLCGTIDLDADYMGQRVLVDHKTTSSWNTYDYLAEYDLSPQLMIYKYMYDKLHGTDVGVMINGIFLSKTKQPTFKRSDVIRFSKMHIDNLIAHMTSKVEDIVYCFEEYLDTKRADTFPANYCACVKRYGEKASPCLYKMLCTQPTIDQGLEIAASMFEAKMYNPMTHQL